MEFDQVVSRRRMIRNFTEAPVDPSVLEHILERGLHGPSAGFSQGWAFLVLERPEDRARFWSATARPGEQDSWAQGLQRAPVLIVACSCKAAYLRRYAEPDKGWTDEDEARWPVPYWHIDTGMASLLMLLAAVDAGLGACFFGVPPAELRALRAAFSIPDDHDPIGVIAIGHPAPDRRSPSLARGRRPVHEVVHRGRW